MSSPSNSYQPHIVSTLCNTLNNIKQETVKMVITCIHSCISLITDYILADLLPSMCYGTLMGRNIVLNNNNDNNNDYYFYYYSDSITVFIWSPS